MRAFPRTTVVAALSLIAACNTDSLVNAPREPASPPASTPQATPHLVVIDSTRLPFAGSAAERAAGQYVYHIRDSVPAIHAGDYVAGRQGGLYLGRVVALSQQNGYLTLDLAAAQWRDVFQPFTVHIPFTPGAGSAPSPYGLVRWGPWHVVRAAGPLSSAPAIPFRRKDGRAIEPDDFNPVGFLLNNFDLCAAASVVSVCGGITAQVLNADFSFTGGVDVGADIDFTNLSIDAHALINEQLNTSLDFQLTGHGSVEVDVPIPDAGFERDFQVGTTSGKVEVGFIIGVEGDITDVTVEPHVQVSDTVTTGATVSSNSGFNFQYTGAGHFDAGVKVIDLGDLGVKLSVGPKVEVKLDFGDGHGLDLGAGADGFEEAQLNLEGLLGIGNWHYHTDVGTEADLEGSLDFPLFGVQIGGKETFPGPGVNLLDAWGTGDLDVASSTTGKDIFPGQIYGTTVSRSDPADAPPWFATLSTALGVNDSHLFIGGFLCHQFFQGAPLIPPFVEDPQDCSLVATAHRATLSGWAWNCAPAEALPAGIQVKPRNPFDFSARLTSITLGVTCRSAYAVVRDVVNGLRASGGIDSDGIETALDAKLTAAEVARDAGDVAGADSALVDLMNQLSAQNGKHITLAADAELRGFTTLLRTCYETIVPTCSSVSSPSAALGSKAE